MHCDVSDATRVTERICHARLGAVCQFAYSGLPKNHVLCRVYTYDHVPVSAHALHMMTSSDKF